MDLMLKWKLLKEGIIIVYVVFKRFIYMRDISILEGREVLEIYLERVINVLSFFIVVFYLFCFY